jgi:Glucuronyl esterase, fungi
LPEQAHVSTTAAALDDAPLADANYVEEKVEAYSLPDPLRFENGEPVTSASAWFDKRRPEILRLFSEHVYGEAPGRPAEATISVIEEGDALGGSAIRRQFSIEFGGGAPSIDVLLYLPKDGARPAPTVLGANFLGNHTVHADPAIRLPTFAFAPGMEVALPEGRAMENSRGLRAERWAIERMIGRGYAFATFCYNDLYPDRADGRAASVQPLFDLPGGAKPTWGAIATWSWGMSRVLDALRMMPEIDGGRVALMGHSRLGKAALWAAAVDQRFAMVIANNSGKGGASLARRNFGETIRHLVMRYPLWFTARYASYADRSAALPVDQHMLIALIAPRPVYVASAAGDGWADPKGEFLALSAASPVYELLGAPGLPTDRPPPVGAPITGTMGYHLREGAHGVTGHDWERFLDFADRHLRRPACEPFRAPLRDGDSVGLWRLGAKHEERFDVADQPMSGEMDPAFFVTKTKNFIPHEYPCRRAFAALYRGKRPVPTIAFEPAGWWFSFDGKGVDLSGFWFRPTGIECWAETSIEATEAQTARFRLATCGGAILTVNGAEVAFLSRYQRNFEEAVEIDVALKAGANAVSVWFGDLCERDTRYGFELSVVGHGLSVALDCGISPDEAEEISTLLQGMRFERPSFREGEVALIFPKPVSCDCAVRIGVEGDLPSAVRAETRLVLKAGQMRLVLGTVDTMPAGFFAFNVVLERGGFSLSRALGVEICDPASFVAPPPTLEARAHEALGHVAQRGHSDTIRALAMLATGQGGEDVDAMLRSSLPAITDCHDCADFWLVPLLWVRAKFAAAIGAETLAKIDAAVLGFRYWMDEPGNDVMWYFSENHALLFHTACYLAGSIFPDATFVRSGRKGSAQSAVGRGRVLGWFDRFEADELAEWNSAPYFPIDFKGLAALAALAPNIDVRARAERAIKRLLEIAALSSHRGMLTASQGRSYEHSLRASTTLELSAIARLFFGRGGFGSHVHALPLLALLVRDHGFGIDSRLAELAVWQGDDALEWSYRQGLGGIAALYHYKTRDHATGSVACYRRGEWGYQETVLHLRLGERPESQIWINHPGERIVSGSARPSYWGGCGTLPRVQQYRDLAFADFDAKPEQVDFTHAWLPESEMDEIVLDGDRVGVRAGNALALLVGSAPFVRAGEGPTAGCEIRLMGRRTRWLVRLSNCDKEGSLAGFIRRFAGVRLADGAAGEICLDDPDYGRVVFQKDGLVFAEGRRLDPSSWTHSGRAVRWPKGETFVLPSQE